MTVAEGQTCQQKQRNLKEKYFFLVLLFTMSFCCAYLILNGDQQQILLQKNTLSSEPLQGVVQVAKTVTVEKKTTKVVISTSNKGSSTRNYHQNSDTKTISTFKKNATLERICDEYIQKSKGFTYKPKDMKFLPDYRAFCWRNKSLNCLPNFYLASYPKCGTTDIFDKIISHPDIAQISKEAHWWDTHRIVADVPFDTYLKKFHIALSFKDQIIGDGSPGYFFQNLHMNSEKRTNFHPKLSSDAERALQNFEILPVHVIHRFTPKAKFIVSMREPGDRMYSHYLHMHLSDKRKRASPAKFHSLVVNQIKIFEICVSKHGLRYCAYDSRIRREMDKLFVHLYVGLYSIYAEDAFKLIPKENIKFVNFHKYVKNKAAVMKDLYAFLGVRADNEMMKSLMKGSRFGRIIGAGRFQNLGSMLPETKEILNKFYRPHNAQLAKLLKDDSFLFEND